MKSHAALVRAQRAAIYDLMPQTGLSVVDVEDLAGSLARRSELEPAWAEAASHCGEIFQGPVLGPAGRPVTGLITLPDFSLLARVTVIPDGNHSIHCPPHLLKVLRAVELTLEYFGASSVGLHVQVTDNIPCGFGMGSSTSQCVASVLAVTKMLRQRLTDVDVLRIAHQAEGPCDPLLATNWGLTLLWASHDGIPLEVIPAPLPSLVAVGFVSPGEPICTIELARRTVYTERDVEKVAPILDAVRQAIRAGSARDLASAATRSAASNQLRCRTPLWDELNRLAEVVDAAGLAVSHSGTAAALLWPDDASALHGKIADACERLAAIGATHVHAFSTRGS